MATADDRFGLLVDAGSVVTVAALLAGIHVLVPAGVRATFVLEYARPDPFHAFTAAYVHLTDAHLLGNLTGLLAGGAWAILVSRLADERRWFRLSFLAYLTLLPVAVGMSGAALVGQEITSRGFSGVVAGLGGFGLVGVAVVLHRAFGVDRWLAWDVAAGLVVVLAVEILWLVTGTVTTRMGLLLVGAYAVTLVPVANAWRRGGWPRTREGWRRLAGAVVTTVLLAALLVAFVAGLFPTELGRSGSVTNILGHYLGLVYGAVIAGWGYRYWSAGEA